MNKLYKVNLSYLTYFTLLNDVEVFRFFKKDGSSNKNLFLNKLIYNYHLIINEEIDSFNNDLRSLLKEYNLSNNNINELANSINRLLTKKDNSKERKEYELTFLATSKYIYAFLDIEDNYLNNLTISEYLRKLFNSYSLLTQDERERIVFNEEIELINKAIKDNKKIIYEDNNEKKIEVTPIGVFNSKDHQFIYLIYFNNHKFVPLHIYKLNKLRISKNIKEELNDDDKNKLNELLTVDAQFISSKIIDVDIKFTKKAKSIYKRIIINRPKSYKIDNEHDIYSFKAPINQLFQYFLRFGKEVEVLNNIKLTNLLYYYFKESFLSYKNNRNKVYNNSNNILEDNNNE